MEGKISQRVTFSLGFLGLTSAGSLSYRKFNELPKWEKQSISGMQIELHGCNVLDQDDVISRVFEEILYVGMMSKLEEIKQNTLQNGIEFVKVHSMDAYEMLLQLKQDFEDAIDVWVETKYKMIAKKVKLVATPLPKGSNEVIQEASRQLMLRDPKNIGHKFTEETLKQLKIGKEGTPT
ncbi:hypothetical protein L7F22_021279 [Adiantum nelumboides]|nr:hypothetical protein [Adiantum nelumboides]